ncbi:MAG: hypothetical protein IPH35_06195 [Rhodoferax sp.]|nr:hypothetical protein [Rhodoferax sp.]
MHYWLPGGKLVGQNQQKKTARLVIDSAGQQHRFPGGFVTQGQTAPDKIAATAYPIRLTARFSMQNYPKTARFDASWRYQHRLDPF